jgi:hypothetical protein
MGTFAALYSRDLRHTAAQHSRLSGEKRKTPPSFLKLLPISAIAQEEHSQGGNSNQ